MEVKLFKQSLAVRVLLGHVLAAKDIEVPPFKNSHGVVLPAEEKLGQVLELELLRDVYLSTGLGLSY